MTFQHPALVSLAVAAALLPALASAQAVGSNYVTTSTSPSSATYTSGTTNDNFGTITFTGTQPGTVQIASVPVSVTATNGATAANLSDCELVNGNGTILNNSLTAVSAGTNTITFNTPLSVTEGSPQTLTIQCGVLSGAPTSAVYTFSAGTPTLAPTLNATLTAFPTVDAGAVNAPIAAITLDPSSSGTNVNVTSIPLTATYSGGMTANDLSDCQLTNAGTSVTQNPAGTLSAGANTMTFNATLPLTGGSSATPLLLTCDVLGATPIGGSVTLSLAPAGILASSATTGAAITPGQGYDPTTGSAGALSGTTEVIAAGTTGTGVTGTVVPPNTGAGASAPISIAIMALAALAALMGFGLLSRKNA